MAELGARLRARGMRLTSQRARVVDALGSVGHATPEQLAQILAADGGRPLPLSTVYRALDALQELGIVAHTHVDHRATDYHLAEHARHVHLSCRGCGTVTELPLGEGEQFASAIRSATGFVPDLTHAAIHGLCAACAARPPETSTGMT